METDERTVPGIRPPLLRQMFDDEKFSPPPHMSTQDRKAPGLRPSQKSPLLRQMLDDEMFSPPSYRFPLMETGDQIVPEIRPSQRRLTCDCGVNHF